MPLLRKKPFERLHVSSDFRENDEVFHCEYTDEVFKDYNEYCERIILCTSLVWSCSITGKSNMTYPEAVQCEENARKNLKEFPLELKLPILYLASKTNRTSLSDMIEDVFQYARERYFIGEMVEACFAEDSWTECHVLQVIEPTAQQIKEYEAEENRNTQETKGQLPARIFRYEVEELDESDSGISRLMIVDASHVRRRKQLYTKERIRIFLRHHCEQNEKGIWVVKESVAQKCGIAKIRFDTIFAGPPPDFSYRPKKTVKHRQESIDKFLVADVSKQRAFDKPDPLRKVNESGMVAKKFRKPKMNGKFKEDLKARALEEKAKRKEESLQKRERKREEKQKLAALAAFVRDWNKPREDLECEDLRPVPDPIPVNCRIPNEKFGDAAMILEFLHFFSEQLEVNSFFAHGMNLELMERALLDDEASGPWSDLLQLLLANIFKFQSEEEDEIHAQASDLDDVDIEQGPSSMAEAVKLATIASAWCPTHQGCQLSELPLEHVTLSEILRQHLLSSGRSISEVASKWRYSQRGGFTNHDDPALLLRMNDAHILRMLGHRNACELNLDDRIKVLHCLQNQLLTFASIRDVIEERYEKVHQAKKELKSFIIAEQKKEKEEREKLKEREKEGKVEEDDQKVKKVTRSHNDEEKKKEEYETKLKELQKATKDAQLMVYLGSDRAHRRFWRFLSIPGVFVENDERWPGDCIPEGTILLPELQDKDTAYAYLKNKFEDEFNDKENNYKKAKKSPKKGAFVDKNGVKSPRKSSKDSKSELNALRKRVLACTGSKDCPVHSKRTGPKWSFIGRSEDLEDFIKTLNPRGIRESELRNNLMQETGELMSIIEECPRHKLNSDVFKASIKESTGKNSRKTKYEVPNLNFPAEVTVNDVMELTLRDCILDMEEKIKSAYLGSLKVNDREAWRKAINNRSYDKQCEKLVYGSHEIEADIAPNLTLEKLKGEVKNGSRPNTPDSEVGSTGAKTYKDPGKYLGPPGDGEFPVDPQQQVAIRQMACAILQLFQALDSKFLRKPLGSDEKDKKWSGEEAIERWEQSLMALTSWSQLFVHLKTLEGSIAWGKSALNAQCRICRRRRDAEKMLLCDGCNRGHHMYCLKPKLTEVPEGDWFCYVCKPETKPKVARKRKIEEDIDEDIVPSKEARQKRTRRAVVNGDLENDDDEEDIDMNMLAVCSSCRCGGKLIRCDTCSSNFHPECLEPSVSRAPRGKWSCPSCNKAKRKNGNYSDSSASDDVVVAPRQTRRAAKRFAVVDEEQDKNSLKGCAHLVQELIHDLTHNKDSWPFLSPVTKDEVPDYHQIIKHPMDFGTIKSKLSNGEYKTLDEFYGDCALVFNNCERYNQENSEVYKAGVGLLKHCGKRCKDLGLNFEEINKNLVPAVKVPSLENSSTTENKGTGEHEDTDVPEER